MFRLTVVAIDIIYFQSYFRVLDDEITKLFLFIKKWTKKEESSDEN